MDAAELPWEYAVAWRLREAGASADLIAVAVGVPVESIDALLEVAAAKLRRAGDRDGGRPPT